MLAATLACMMTFSMTTVAQAKGDKKSDKEITIGVTSFADTLEPTEQYFSWVISRYGVGQGLTKFDEEGNMVTVGNSGRKMKISTGSEEVAVMGRETLIHHAERNLR